MPGTCPVGQEVEMEDNYREVKKAEPCLKLIHMDQVEVEEIEWLFYPFIPYGKVTIIQGDPGEGKTTVVLQIIAKLTKGEAILSETSEGKSEETGVEPINVIYQTAEDGLGDTIKPRLLAAGADCSRVLVIDDQDQPLTMVDARLEEAIIQTKARLVVLDPIQGFLGAGVDMHRANEIRPLMKRISVLAEKYQCATFGVHQEFISSGRLDDLSMCWAGVEAMIAADATSSSDTSAFETTRVLAIFDNEETGSQTKQGAGSPFLSHMLQRIALAQSGTEEAYYQAVERAFMISADNAHAWHPNYSEKFDPTNHPMLGGGPVIKFNAAQKYASDAVSAAIFASICDAAGVPCQRFVNHSDVAGGSTLGNILASSIPLKGVDMGNAILAMHSCRETGSVIDHEYCVKAFTKFYQL